MRTQAYSSSFVGAETTTYAQQAPVQYSTAARCCSRTHRLVGRARGWRTEEGREVPDPDVPPARARRSRSQGRHPANGLPARVPMGRGASARAHRYGTQGSSTWFPAPPARQRRQRPLQTSTARRGNPARGCRGESAGSRRPATADLANAGTLGRRPRAHPRTVGSQCVSALLRPSPDSHRWRGSHG